MYNKKLKWYNLNRKVKVIIPKKVQHQIDYLCREISNVEWSGVLFYDTEGSIENKENFKVTLKHVFPMDKGTGGSTEYDLDNDNFINFRMSHPESLKWKIGHIHSHNNMGAYFSGTDNDEIEENSEFHNYYLSIVVNNAGNVVGKIGIRGVSEDNSPYKCKSENGHPWALTVQKKEDVIFSIECEIDKYTPVVDEEFKTSVADIIKKKKNKISLQQQQKQIGYGSSMAHHGYAQSQIFDMPVNKKEEEDLQQQSYDDMIEDWVKYYLSFGNNESDSMSMDDILDIIKNSKENTNVYISQLLEQTDSLFLRFFEVDNFNLVTIIEDTIIELYSYDNDITTKVAITLEHLLKKMEKNDKR